MYVFNIFSFGVKERNLISVKVSLEFQTIFCDYSYKRPSFTYRHIAF